MLARAALAAVLVPLGVVCWIAIDEVPHVMVRMCVAGCILAMSGKLDELEVE